MQEMWLTQGISTAGGARVPIVASLKQTKKGSRVYFDRYYTVDGVYHEIRYIIWDSPEVEYSYLHLRVPVPLDNPLGRLLND